MMDLIKNLNDLKEAYGYDAFVEHYNPPTGYYFIISKDKDDVFIKNDGFVKDKSTGEMINQFSLNEHYNFLNERLFFEGMVSSNKCVDTKNKKIHSVTPYCLIFKYEFLLNENRYDILKSHLEILRDNYKNEFDVVETLNIFNEKITEIEKELKDKASNTDRIIIINETEIEKCKEAYFKYLRKKCFVKDETIIQVEENGKLVDYGVAMYSISLNSKKPLLSNSIYSRYPYRVSVDNAMLLILMNKLKPQIAVNLLNEINKDVETGLYIDMNSTTKSNEICEYDYNKTVKSKSSKIGNIQDFYEVNLISSDFETVISEKLKIDRNELKAIINKNLTNHYSIDNLLKIKNSDYKDFLIKNGLNIGEMLITNKDLLKSYFETNNSSNNITSFEKLLFNCYLEILKTNMKKAKKSLDLIPSILNYINKGGYLDMANNIKLFWDKLVQGKKDCKYEITSNEEFFFASGQLLYWLTTFNESLSSNKLDEILKVRNSNDIKNRAINMYSKYAYKMPKFNISFINILFNAVISYEIDNVLKLNKFNYKYYYNAGAIGKNIKFEKIKVDNDESTEEI